MTAYLQTQSTLQEISRRRFVGGVLGAAASATLLADGGAIQAEPDVAPAAVAGRKLKLGVVGNGGRGRWISTLFKEHGGFEIYAVADYFQRNADACGDLFGVDKSRRFDGLSGYKKLIESGVEAIAVITPPYAIPEIATAGAAAGLHCYLAKPVAVDVPGCLQIGAAGKTAAQKQRVFLVDYQIPTDPQNIAVRDAVRQGNAGKLARLQTIGISGGSDDVPKGPTIENLLEHAIWNYHIALSGGWNVSYDIHAIDAAVWLLGQVPVAATGYSRIVRPDPHSDAAAVTSTIFEYADGLIHEHFGQALPDHAQQELNCKAYSYNARAFVEYWGNALFQVRGQKPLGGPVKDLYPAGAKRNIAAFHQAIVHGDYGNETAQRSVDSTLTAILGREAAARRTRLTMDELMKENRRIEADLRGLKQ